MNTIELKSTDSSTQWAAMGPEARVAAATLVAQLHALAVGAVEAVEAHGSIVSQAGVL